MNMALQIFCCLIAAEFAYIFYLETVIPDSGTTAKVFGMDVKDLKMPAMRTAMKNQGVYNLGIAVLLVLAVFVLHSRDTLSVLPFMEALLSAKPSSSSRAGSLLLRLSCAFFRAVYCGWCATIRIYSRIYRR